MEKPTIQLTKKSLDKSKKKVTLKKDRRGGQREGAGRKKDQDPNVSFYVKVRKSKAEKLGGGDHKVGVKILKSNIEEQLKDLDL